jgi:mannonate dehydratase
MDDIIDSERKEGLLPGRLLQSEQNPRENPVFSHFYKENSMKFGLGLYKSLLTRNNYRFARQAGCTHIIAHLANYYASDIVPTTNGIQNYGISVSNQEEWSYENLLALRKEMEQEGLTLHGIENFSPSDWYDILLDGPAKNVQMENLKQIIRNVGKAGIPVFGYNFSIAGVWGHTQRPVARGGASTACFDYADGGASFPIPAGQVWNMTYAANTTGGILTPVTSEQLWERLAWFLNELIPVAEEAGVKLAAHPDDPPMKTIRGHARLVHQIPDYQKLINLNPSPSNCLEFCMGSIQEMSEGDVYQAITAYAPQNRIGYIHFRNVRGKVPSYQETFVDDGDIDMIHALRLLHDNGYDGVIIPDHTPLMTCDAPWHAGMAFALGYMHAAFKTITEEKR